MLIIAGLGNPGAKYQNHRHNVGFMAADAIARRHSFSPWSKKFNALVAEGRLGGQKVLLVKPQTFMNRSGQAVGEALRYFKRSTDDLVVLYDELDLAPGKVRVKTGGGAGGHNGIRSIDAHCGTAYRRVRIGIGHPGDKARVNAHVLGDFAKADGVWLEPLLDAVADAASLLAEGDESGFMNRIALTVKPYLPQPEKAGRKRTDKAGADKTSAAPEAGGAAKTHPAGAKAAKRDQGDPQSASEPPSPEPARPSKPDARPSGTMAAMLKKLLGR